jgi:hypothetical protein
LVVDASTWPKADRDAAVDWVFDHPHRYLLDDIAWAKARFGQDAGGCREMFKSARRLGIVMKDARPLYLFSISDQTNLMSMASEERLDGAKWYLTRALVKFCRSDAGKALLKGVIAAAEVSDIARGLVRIPWALAMNFQPYAQRTYGGQTFQFFSYRGA